MTTSMASQLPRRVLVVNRVAFLGGVERIILTLAAGMQAYGWDMILACPKEGALPDAARAQGTRVLACPFDRMRITTNPAVLARYPFSWMHCAAALETHCRENQVDLIHVHHPVSAIYAARAVRRLGIPMLLHVHETLPARPLYAMAMKASLRYAARVLCVSGAALELAISLGADPSITRVVHNGVDQRFFAPDLPCPAPEVLRAGPGPHIGIFAVLEPRKAQHVLLEAAARLVDRFPQARFWIIGEAALKDKMQYADELRRMAADSRLQGRVQIVGFQPDVPAWLAAMDIVVQTSTELESFGMVLAEAQVLGRPVVASRVGGMPEVVADGKTGLIVPPGDASALASALARLLDAPALRHELGRHGAEEARRRFAPGVFRRQVAGIYATAMKG